MRTTLSIDDDALAMARELGQRRRISLGRAVSELVRRGARVTLPTMVRGGLQVAQLQDGSPAVTAESIERLKDDLP